jgi:chemotaxis protein CheX
MKVEYINPFLTATIDVFNTMLRCPLTRGKPFAKGGPQPQYDVSGIIGLSGTAKGIVVLSSTATFCYWRSARFES